MVEAQEFEQIDAERLAAFIKTAHERIYLQIADESLDDGDKFSNCTEVTWCANSVVASEVPYVRADLVAELVEALRFAYIFGTWDGVSDILAKWEEKK